MPTERPIFLNELNNTQAEDFHNVPEDYVQKNQAHWRKAKRGIFSRPLELPHSANALHDRMVKTFGLKDAQSSILTISLAFDNPSSASSAYVHQEAFPQGVKEKERHEWSIGIGRINEYVTNYAAREFIRLNTDLPVIQQIARAYGGVFDFLTYGLFFNGTYTRMRGIERMAKDQGKDYKGALLSALFQHDSNALNEIIAMTSKFTGYSNIDELAINIGRDRFKKPDIGKWLDNLDTRREDKKRATSLRNGVISVAGAGAFRNPGVIETSGALVPFLAGVDLVLNEIQAEAGGMGFINHPEHASLLLMARYLIPDYFVPLAAQTLEIPAVVAISLLPFVAIHEGIHHYSSSKDFMGLIPAEIIHKEVTPYKSKLEPRE